MLTHKKYFGTDGIRGPVGEHPITVDFILKLGWAIGKKIINANGTKVVIGKDTRISGYMIESALQAGLSSAGVDVLLLGPMPAPGLAYLTKAFRADAGILISASHNPYYDNGIKIFQRNGFKVNKAFESSIEQMIELPIETVSLSKLGKAFRIEDAAGRYIEFCKSSVMHHLSLQNLKIVVDCAHGATYHIAPLVFQELGANVIPINITPDGVNINEKCGPLNPEAIQKAVIHHQADLGISFDGDGDRVLLIDHKGEIIDGDQILYVIAQGLKLENRLIGGVVGTHMSNLGLEHGLLNLDIPFKRAGVGDQNLIEALHHNQWLLGGEPSGHIVYLPVATTSDGIIAALQAIQTLIFSGNELHDIKNKMTKFPQKLTAINHHGNKIDLEHSVIKKLIKQQQLKLAGRGRILIRPSGTEPLIRVMVEGEDVTLVKEIANDITDAIQKIVNRLEKRSA
ncbi:MAG: phosphoglucosamine mutase [Gammaproteobacteria bacterium]|nr:phosphoglucosamine mutase [Gammaproteobacteria bacterium]